MLVWRRECLPDPDAARIVSGGNPAGGKIRCQCCENPGFLAGKPADFLAAGKVVNPGGSIGCPSHQPLTAICQADLVDGLGVVQCIQPGF